MKSSILIRASVVSLVLSVPSLCAEAQTQNDAVPKTPASLDSNYTGGADAFEAKVSPQGCCVGIRGNVDGDPGDLVDIGDVMGLVTYLSGYGDAPPCYLEDDANGSGVIDIADIAFLVSYLVFGGPSVLCP